MLRSLFQDHLQGSSFALNAPTTLHLHASSFVCIWYVVVCPLFVCVSGVPACVLSGVSLCTPGLQKFIIGKPWDTYLRNLYR
jgi:hypothetical protein